jgi:ADP-ribose pyrophosphatase YjhB (NUDIX family)
METEKQILNLFAFHQKLKFHEIERELKIRSNLLAYYIGALLTKGVLKKEERHYSLADSAEYLIPYFSDKQAALPVALVQIGSKKQAFLHKREKRPYKGLLSLPGGRILIGESPQKAAKRIMKTKFNIEISNEKIKLIALEHVKKNKRLKHTFILFVVSASSEFPIFLTDIEKNKRKITKSDYLLIKSNDTFPCLKTVISKED